MREEALAAEQNLEAKLSEIGLGRQARGNVAAATEVAADQATPTPEPEPTPQLPARNEQGQFAKAEETAPEAPAAEDPTGDPAIAAYLGKYGGDVDKALQAAVQAQRKLGEMGSELGQQRAQAAEYQRVIDELDQIKTTLAQPAQQPQQWLPDQQTVDWVEDQIATNPAQAAHFAQQAKQANQPLLYERIMRSWHQFDPYAASQFTSETAVAEARQQWQAQAPAVDDATGMQLALSNVLNKHPEFNQYASDLEGTVARYPGVTGGLSGNQAEKEQAIEALFALAERDTLRSLAFSGQTPQETATEQGVVTASTSDALPTEPEAEPSPLDAFRQQFRDEASRYSGDRATPGFYTAH